MALHTGVEKDCDMALKAIKESESYGNDEKINRSRLRYKSKSNEVFNILKKNNQVINEVNTKEYDCE